MLKGRKCVLEKLYISLLIISEVEQSTETFHLTQNQECLHINGYFLH